MPRHKVLFTVVYFLLLLLLIPQINLGYLVVQKVQHVLFALVSMPVVQQDVVGRVSPLFVAAVESDIYFELVHARPPAPARDTTRRPPVVLDPRAPPHVLAILAVDPPLDGFV